MVKALRNMIEQTLLFGVNLFALAHVNALTSKTVILFTALFTASRVGYWLGYLFYAITGKIWFRGFVVYGFLMSVYMMWLNLESLFLL
jgi:hypothetical protein